MESREQSLQLRLRRWQWIAVSCALLAAFSLGQWWGTRGAATPWVRGAAAQAPAALTAVQPGAALGQDGHFVTSNANGDYVALWYYEKRKGMGDARVYFVNQAGVNTGPRMAQ